MKILDCTLRDGGYYTQWDFDKPVVDQYIKALNHLPIDYIEVGYRSTLQTGYFGKYFYLPLYELRDLKNKSDKKLSVMLNEKDIRIADLTDVLEPVVGIVDMVRIAVKPQFLERAIRLGKAIKEMGFELCMNLMYMSKWVHNEEFLQTLEKVDGTADVLYVVDSYGGSFPNEVAGLVQRLKAQLNCDIGFHGHNNLETALTNTMAAFSQGADFIDGTIMGMGRGAGNLKTELLLTVLNKELNLDVNFNALEEAVNVISPLSEKYRWGTNLSYMISGSNSLPQSEVIERTTVRYYTLNDIVDTLQLESGHRFKKFPNCNFKTHNKILIVGGGPSVRPQQDGLRSWLNRDPDIAIIHASSKNADCFKGLPHEQYFCLVGNEGRRLQHTLKDLSNFNGTCILPPYPITKKTFVPKEVFSSTYELEKIEFAGMYHEAHTAIALQTALNCNPKEVFFAGYDGYRPEDFGTKERKLIKENEYLFYKFGKRVEDTMSLTATNYSLPATHNLFYELSTPKKTKDSSYSNLKMDQSSTT